MWEKLKKLIHTRGFEVSIYFILGILVINSILILRYREIIKENVELKEDLLRVNSLNDAITANINRADMGLRGYLLVPEETMVSPFNQAYTSLPQNLTQFESLVAKYGYDVSKMKMGKKAMIEYMELVKTMVEMTRKGNTDQTIAILQSDPGFAAWENYYPMQSDISGFVNELNSQANKEYNTIIGYTRISQIIILLLFIPFLIAIARRLRRSQNNRKKLFSTINENQRKYLFNPGMEQDDEIDDSLVIDELVKDLRKASGFINNITDGNYNITWEGLNDSNYKFNDDTLSGELVKMRDQMIKVRKEDEKRLWTTEGLSKFGEIIRNYQSNINSLADHIISELVKYLNAKQGGVFILNDESEYDKYLELTGCYAYERKKFLEKKVEIGDGLVGQCYLEKEHIYLKNIPQDYVMITSGLGEANPSSLLLVPLKNESTVIGVLEIASLKEFEQHQIDFVLQLGESIASAVQNVKINQSTHNLLERTQQQAEEMRAQEEEMRQNMEELQATQESLNRESKEKEKFQLEMERTKNFLETVINTLPDPIFVKDRDHKLVILNDAVCEFNGWDREKVLGKSDFDLFPENEAQKMYDSEEELFSNRKDIELEIEATRSGKKTYVIDKKRVIEDDMGNLFIVGINIDISDLKKIEQDLAKEKYLLDAMLDNMPDSIYFKDHECRFIRVSKSMITGFGFKSNDELLGKTDFDFQDEEHAQQAYNDEVEIMKSENPIIDVVEKETFEDGSIRWVSTTKMPLRDLNNNVVGTFGISRDISKIKNLELGYQTKLEEVQKVLEEKEKIIKSLKTK